MTVTKKLTIFEGLNGSGKSVAAKRYAQETGALYVHFHAFPDLKKGLAKMYAEGMLPALMGYQDVVFDRSWISERPYAMTQRDGQDRLDNADRRMLERLALRCGGVVIRCRPAFETIIKNLENHHHEELRRNHTIVRQLYNYYDLELIGLPMNEYDFQVDSWQNLTDWIDYFRPLCHPLDVQSAGNWRAPYVLVGEKFADHKDYDLFYQWPFASFSNIGCSRWLTQQLEKINVRECDLFWLNADQNLAVLAGDSPAYRLVVALGSEASQALTLVNIQHSTVPHPQYWKRFIDAHSYTPLLGLLDDAKWRRL